MQMTFYCPQKPSITFLELLNLMSNCGLISNCKINACCQEHRHHEVDT